jgi:radical SAM protein with 4Fe4S-binding SPASM domain
MRYILAKDAVLKWLEKPSVYVLKRDELYELDDEAFEYLRSSAAEEGGSPVSGEFIEFCLEEGILVPSDLIDGDIPGNQRTVVERPPVIKSPVPSLRYLELQITDRCNLRCRHCYIGESLQYELILEQISRILKEFEEMQGLRVLITGGEPLLHSSFAAINAVLPDYFLRKVLFTNGLLLSDSQLAGLNFDEIQISIDGLEHAHDALRGKGTFSKAMDAVQRCLDKGIDVSVSTMVHAKNLGDFDAMDDLFRKMGIKDWTVDVPCATGRLQENSLFQLTPEEGGKYLGYGFGGGIHASAPGFGCGLHLMSVSADGSASKCTFYRDRPAGHINEGLRECWQRISPVRLQDLDCRCAYLETCRGGCRYRAEQQGNALGPDWYKCHYYGIIKSMNE